MEKLKEWIRKSGKSQNAVAREILINTTRMSRLCNGWEPTLKEIIDIEDFTKRKVKAQDWLDSFKQKGKTQ